jgi:hypothetical protein
MARVRRRMRTRMHRTRVSVHHPRTRAFLSGDNLLCSVKASDVNVYVCRSELYRCWTWWSMITVQVDRAKTKLRTAAAMVF